MIITHTYLYNYRGIELPKLPTAAVNNLAFFWQQGYKRFSPLGVAGYKQLQAKDKTLGKGILSENISN